MEKPQEDGITRDRPTDLISLEVPAEFDALSDDAFIRRFLVPATWKPIDYPESAWWGHLPFMFSLVSLMRPRSFVELGTHHGASFFAACQAAQRLQLPMKSWAVDTWIGEIHSGTYEESVYDAFLEVLEEREYDDATALKMLFDDAVELFEPQTIDLLHIDGLHTYEAVRHDYETWIDRVTPGGVVLFHDIDVHERDFGVWRLWREIRDTGLSHTFEHSHGLGVLQVHGGAFPQIDRLLGILRAQEGNAEFSQLFLESVGEAVKTAAYLEVTRTNAGRLRDEKVEIEAAYKQAKASLDSHMSKLSSVVIEREKAFAGLNELKLRSKSREQQLTSELAAAIERSAEFEGELEASQAETLATEHESREQMEQAHARAAARQHNLKARIEKKSQRIDALTTQLAIARSATKQREARLNQEHGLEADSLMADLERIGQRRAIKLTDKVRGKRTLGPTPVDERSLKAHEVFLAAELGSCGLFDAEFYEKEYADVATFPDGPIMHFIRHGRFEGRKPNQLFDPAEYLLRNKDVSEAGVEPVEHYLLHGAYGLRSIGQEFDSPWYLMANPDVVDAGGNPLGHYLRFGATEGRRAMPGKDPKNRWRDGSREANGHKPFRARRNVRLNKRAEEAVKGRLDKQHQEFADEIDAMKVSIVMPTFNRARQIAGAIRSVMAQSHANWELLIIDDGSTDGTAEVVDRFLRDDRVSYAQSNHVGVSAVRNVGLDRADGDYIAYLDTDNKWVPNFLRFMLTALHDSGRLFGYSGMNAIDAEGKFKHYFGAEFDWDQCLRSNYVDLNVFIHSRNLSPSLRFDVLYRRMVDWDFILRLTKDKEVQYVPFSGCNYLDDDNAKNRISRSEPKLFGEVIKALNDPTSEYSNRAEFAQDLSLEIAIRISSPWSGKEAWGDYFFGKAFADALCRAGHDARLIFHDDLPSENAPRPHEINIVLRGLTEHGPVPGCLNILWVISNADMVTPQEMASYNLVYLASKSHCDFVQHDLEVKPRLLLQATEFVSTPPVDPTLPNETVFVGNSRGARRPIVEWLLESGEDAAIFGQGWHLNGAYELVHEHNIDNARLPSLYGNACSVLNDHWPSMLAFGYVSNRIFDVLGAGGRPISDRSPAITDLFGAAVAQVGDSAQLQEAVAAAGECTEARGPAPEWIDAVERVRKLHTFDNRAGTVLADIFDYLNLPHEYGDGAEAPLQTVAELESATGRRPNMVVKGPDILKVGLVMMPSLHGYQSSAYIRLLSPLTSEGITAEADVVATGDQSCLRMEELDVVVIQRAAIDNLPDARRFVSRVRAAGIKLVCDNDDALNLVDEGHRRLGHFQQMHQTIEYLIGEADLAMYSTEELVKNFATADETPQVIVANTLDERLWRHFRNHPAGEDPRSASDPLRLLYMGTATHDADFEVVQDALDIWAEEMDFELTIVGAVRNPPSRPWIEKRSVDPGNEAYPRFVAWLRRLGHFDIGIAPLQDTAFNTAKSDIKLLDYIGLGVVPVVSDLAAYDRSPSFTAIRAKNSPESWLDALREAAGEVESASSAESTPAKLREEYLWSERDAFGAGREMLKLFRDL